MTCAVRAAAVASAPAPDLVPDVALAPAGEDWMARAESIAREVGARLQTKAGLPDAEWARLPCLVGSSSHFIGALETQPQPRFDPPLLFARQVAGWLGSGGPVVSVDTACTSGITALALAGDMIAAGECRHALVVGVELANRLSREGFGALGLLTSGVARPCDRRRDGLALGEALAALLVSTTGPWRVAALAAEIDPAGLAAPAPNEQVIGRAMRAALAGAQWRPGDVDLLKLQAGGSPSGDLAEARALRALFPAPPRSVSLKGAIGHTLGASGPAELALLIRSLEGGRVPATVGFAEADAELGLVPAGGEGSSVRRLLFNVAGFGGSVASLTLERA